MSEKDDPLKYVREIQRLMKEGGEEELPDFTRKGEIFWPTSNTDIFKAHPDAVKGVLYKAYEKN